TVPDDPQALHRAKHLCKSKHKSCLWKVNLGLPFSVFPLSVLPCCAEPVTAAPELAIQTVAADAEQACGRGQVAPHFAHHALDEFDFQLIEPARAGTRGRQREAFTGGRQRSRLRRIL